MKQKLDQEFQAIDLLNLCSIHLKSKTFEIQTQRVRLRHLALLFYQYVAGHFSTICGRHLCGVRGQSWGPRVKMKSMFCVGCALMSLVDFAFSYYDEG